MNQVVQRIGRVIRKHEGKDLALIYVIYISDTKDDDILQIIRKVITTKREEIVANSILEDKEGKRKDSFLNNNRKSTTKSAEKRRLEKAYRIIESSLIEPMIIELKDYRDSSGGEESNNQNIPENNKRLFRVRSSLKEKNKYYDVDIENKTCSCPDFNFRKNKCKHIVATELYLF